MPRVTRARDEEALRPVGQGPVVTVRPPAPSKPREPEPPEPDEPGLAMVPPRWAPLTATAICVLAFADSAYLTYAHFTSASVLACSTKGFVDCAAVTTSAYSHPLGVPVVIPGLIWCAVMGVLVSPWVWRPSDRPWWPWVGRLRIAGSVAGVGMVCYLLWAELIKLHHLCEYCTGVHVLTGALFLVIVFGTALSVPAEAEPAAT
ncbi:MAG: vitamin K epoxide reductase family protein [Actinomycetota bacterium]|nr:vitamin K epoxide reductase family protein [Actinomycetota bacterium]